ncbi:uncharacterized protein [Periplaneta americana]|uniref:uncharacterized protein n=1 Tax=Periplaneta americana TaxID=6978 RepID=UPI0037E98E9F
MVRDRVRTTDRCSWSEENMQLAMRAFKVDGMPLSTAAKTFSVPRNTLRRRVISNENIPKFGQHTTFTKETELQFVEHLLKLDTIGYGLTYKELRSLAYRYAFSNGIKHNFNNDLQAAGKDWIRGFLSRHQNLSLRVAEGLSYSRAKGMTKDKIAVFYSNLSKLMDELSLWNKPSHIYNCDETGLQLIYKPRKVISMRGKRDVVSQTNCEKGETVSVMACVSATGQYVPPFVVMKGQRYNDNFELGMPSGTKIVLSESGYMKWEQFSQFLDHFINVKPLGPVILILDGHGSHCSDPPTLEKAVVNNVHMLCLPPHSTHRLQPLDVALFGPLKTFYNDSCRSYVRRNPGKGINKVAFGAIFAEAWNRAATVGIAVHGFDACGIHPFNPDRLPDHVFVPAAVHEDTNSPLPNAENPEVQTVGHTSSPRNNEAEELRESTVTQPREEIPNGRSLEELSPIPSTSGIGQRKRKVGESQILKNTSFIAELKNKKAKAAARNTKKTKSDARAKDSDDMCKVCKKLYKQGENWVKCLNCASWFHVVCVENGNDPYFVCEDCYSDESD